MSLLFNILKVGIGLRCSDQCPDFWELQLSVVSYGHNDKILKSFTYTYMKMQYITMEGQHTMTGLRGNSVTGILVLVSQVTTYIHYD